MDEVRNLCYSLMAQTKVAKSIQIYECTATGTCNVIFVNMRQIEQHQMEKHKQNIYGFSTQSSVHMMYSPMMYMTYDTSIRMEQNGHIKAQKGVNYESPNICPDEEAKKPCIESFNSVKPDGICSKGGAAEEEHVVEDETRAENSNDVRERLTEDLGHEIWNQTTVLSLVKYAAKEELPRKNMWLKMKQKKTLMMSVKG